MKKLSFLVVSLIAAVATAQTASQSPAASQQPTAADPWGSLLANLKARELGPSTMSGRITDLAVFNKEPRIFYIASASGGLWKTENGGITVVPVFDKESTVSLGAVAVSQKTPDLVWVGTGEGTARNSIAWGDGVYKSLDGGKTWKNMGLKETLHISKIVMDPNDNDIVYVAALGRVWGPNPERGVFKTTDGGKTWNKVLYADDKTGAADLAMDPSNPRALLCSMWGVMRKAYDFTSGGAASGLFRTTDGGRSWHKVTKGMPPGPFGRIGLSFMANKANVVVATVEYKPQDQPAPTTGRRAPAISNNAGGTFRSTDHGESWTRVNALNPRPFYFSRPEADPTDDQRIYLCAVSFHYSEDAGKTFRTMRVNDHPDHHAIWIDPKDNHHIITGTDGGVFQTRDRGEHWEHLENLPVGQYYAVAFDMRKPYWVYGGLQDNNSWAFPTQTSRGGPVFTDAYTLSGGDGFHSACDPNDWRNVYSESQAGGIVRMDQKTGQSRYIQPRPHGDGPYRFNWSAPFILSNFNSTTLYMGGNKVFKSVDRGDHWKTISGDLTTNDPKKLMPGKESVTPENTGAENHCTIITISESPTKQGLVWVGTDDGLVQLTQDDGVTWTNVTANIHGLPANTWCSRVTASKWSEGRCYATFDGHRDDDFKPYLYVTEDFGKTWAPLGAGLPDYDNLYVVTEGQLNPDLLFLGSEMSMRMSLDRGKTWSKFKSNFPTVAVHDLVVHPRDLDLIIATHGRALWTLNESALEQLTTDALKQDVVLCRPQPVYLVPEMDNGLSWNGDRLFRSPNTQPGADICYYVKKDAPDVKIVVSTADGSRSENISGSAKVGLNVVRWNARLSGRLVAAGDYRISMTIAGKEYVTSVHVDEASQE